MKTYTPPEVQMCIEKSRRGFVSSMQGGVPSLEEDNSTINEWED